MAMPSNHKDLTSILGHRSRLNGPVIVGAGPTGLAAAARYRKRGVSSIVVLESASSISSLWQSKPHISSKFCHLPKHIPDRPYPTERQFTKCLEYYAKKHEINPRFNVCVQSAMYDRTTRLWRVQTGNNKEVVREYFCKWLVDATGEEAVRVTPEIDGLSRFLGPIIHARDYASNSGKKRFKGKKVLVVGCGNSDMDISHDLLISKAFPIMVHPSLTSVHVSLGDFLGFESSLLILMLLFSPLCLVQKLLLIMACFVMDYKDKYGLTMPSMMGLLRLMNSMGKTQTKSGDIKVVPGIKRLYKGTVEFVNGEKLDIDAVVHATGYYNHNKCNEEPLKLLEGQMPINRSRSKKHLQVPRRPCSRESSIKKNHSKSPTILVESSSIVATDLTNNKKDHVSATPWRRKSQIDEESIIRNSGGVIQNLVPRNPPGPSTDFILVEITVVKSAPVIQKMIKSTRDGLASGQSPILSKHGEGGTYFMGDSTGNDVSVFKPTDEEPNAVNNPRGRRSHSSSDGEGLKKGTRAGQGAYMEVAAYVLDHPMSGRRKPFGDEAGLAGVLPSTMAKCLHKKLNHPGEVTAKTGSLQMFQKNDGSCADFSYGVFPVEEVHKITVLDIRLANADRHDGNILVIRKKNTVILVPIDHGYCLPTSFGDCTFVWLNWRLQAHQPYSPEIIEYIKSLDAEEDIALLESRGLDLPIERAQTLRISTMLLKKGVERGMTPFAIGSLMCREFSNKESVIEEIVQEARNSVPPGTSEAISVDIFSQIMDRRLDEIVQSNLL